MHRIYVYRYDRLGCGYHTGGAAYEFFETSTSPIIQKMFKKMSIEPDALNCLRKAIQIDICCVMGAGAADYLNQRNLSDKYGRGPIQKSTSSTFFLHDGLVSLFKYTKKELRQFENKIYFLA